MQQPTTPATRSRRVRAVAAIGGTAVAAGLGFGSLALANAQDAPAGTDTTQQQPADQSQADPQQGGAAQGGDQQRGGPKGERGQGMAKELASALGLDESKVATALEEVREEERSTHQQQGGRQTPPSEADHQKREDEMASKLAEKLGVDKQKVVDAMTTLRTQHQQKQTEHLTTRLDQAVSAGTLTEADKASVLKAAAAGLLGGPGEGGHGGPGGQGPAEQGGGAQGSTGR